MGIKTGPLRNEPRKKKEHGGRLEENFERRKISSANFAAS